LRQQLKCKLGVTIAGSSTLIRGLSLPEKDAMVAIVELWQYKDTFLSVTFLDVALPNRIFSYLLLMTSIAN